MSSRINARKGSFTGNASNNNVRLALFGIILATTAVAIFFFSASDIDEYQGSALARLSVSLPPPADASAPVQRVVCSSGFKPVNDPNNLIADEYKTARYVNATDPHPFWISLHKKEFDRMRWVAIMDRGEYYETGLTSQFKEILAAPETPPGIVIDVGMNIGWYSLYSRAMGHDVVSFDPNPIMHKRVCTSLKKNGWLKGNAGGEPEDDTTADRTTGSPSGITTYAYGLGNEPGTLNLTMGKNPGGSSFHEARLAPKFRRKIVVPVTTLDTVAAQMGWLSNDGGKKMTPIHLLKIDVEGYEPWVVSGAKRLLGSGLVKNVIMESSSNDAGRIDEMFRTLANGGEFLVHHISNVNGKEVHGEMKEPINKALSDGTFFETSNNYRKYFAENSCNIWWKRKQ